MAGVRPFGALPTTALVAKMYARRGGFEAARRDHVSARPTGKIVTAQSAVRGLRRAELISREPVEAVRFYEKLLGWTIVADDAGIGCWVGDRRSAAVRRPVGAEACGWRLVFAGSREDSSLTGPDDATAEVAKGRAQHGPWAPGPRAGEPCWIELSATDADRADEFWSSSLHWIAERADDSTIYTCAGRPIARRWSEQPLGDQRGWLCYYAVDDLADVSQRAVGEGGRVLGDSDHPALGATVLITDPSGAVFGLAGESAGWGHDRESGL